MDRNLVAEVLNGNESRKINKLLLDLSITIGYKYKSKGQIKNNWFKFQTQKRGSSKTIWIGIDKSKVINV